MDVWHRLADYWRRCGLDVPPGVPEEAIQAFETKYGVMLPADLRAYFLTADGSGEDVDADLHSFWSLAELRPVHEELAETKPDRFSYPGCFVFADHCFSLCDYAVRITADKEFSGPVYRVMGLEVPAEPMAASFGEFVESYLADPKSII
jgi:hypothetical protein